MLNIIAMTAPIMAVLGLLMIILSISRLGLNRNYLFCLVLFSLLTAGAYAFQIVFTPNRFWFAPFGIICWLIIAVVTLARIPNKKGEKK